MKTKNKLFSKAWRQENQFRIMVTSLALLLIMPFFLFQAMKNGNSFLTWFDLGMIAFGMLLIILAA